MTDKFKNMHANPSAKDWTDYFFSINKDCNVPDDVMFGWFANAMMAMHDHCHGNKILNGDHAEYLMAQEKESV